MKGPLKNFYFSLLLLISVYFEIFVCLCQTGPCATLPDGRQLKGTYQTTFGGRKVNAFTNIPYGKAERFASPVPVTTWEGVLDASSPSPLCLQNSPILNPGTRFVGVEDCLNLDVVTPAVRSLDNDSCPQLLPVLVINPGGGFAMLGSAVYGSSFLLDHDVVYAGINSRLGILGYLSTEDITIPGNWGLKDQLLALKWIQKNIEAFCGDPQRVTLIGDSSGAASAFFHSYSPNSRDLTHRVIAMSGSANNHWAFAAASKRKSQELGGLLNCSDVEDSRNLLSCLRSKDGKEIVAEYAKFRELVQVVFGPVIEPPSKDAFLTQDTMKMLKNGCFEKKPVLMSSVTGEGLVPGAVFIANSKLLENVNINWLQIAPHLLDFQDRAAKCDWDSVSTTIRSHYFGDKSISHNTLHQFIKMLGDREITADSAFAATWLACRNTKPVYYFRFNYFGSTSNAQLLGANIEQLNPFGPAHSDDFGYIYNMSYLYQEISKDDIAMMKSMTKMIATFAATGKPEFGPGVTWEPLAKNACSTNTLNHLFINSATDYHMAKATNLGDSEFWNTLPFLEPGTIRHTYSQCP